MRRFYGRPALPITHRDFQAEVPTWGYRLECGHTARYVLRVPWGEYGWCSACREPWVYAWGVDEIHPEHGNRAPVRLRIEAVPLASTLLPDEVLPAPRKKKRQKINPVELSIIQDQAIIRNRVADLIWALEADSITLAEAKWVAQQTNTHYNTVYNVAQSMGLNLSDA